MKASLRTVLAASLMLLAWLPADHASAACALQDQEITGTPKSTIGSFTDAGVFKEDIDGKRVVGRKIVACDESRGLVKVEESATQVLWIDPAEVKVALTGAGCKKTGTKVAGNRAESAGSRKLVSAGADPGCP
jgi:hypothetical protein